MDGQRRELTVDIGATPAEIWRALTHPQMTRSYYYGTDIVSDWTVGSRWTSESGDELYLEGEIVEVDPPHRLVQTFRVAIGEPAAVEPSSMVTWEVTPMGDGSQLHLVHEGIGPLTMEYTEDGWEHILAGLKALLEADPPTG